MTLLRTFILSFLTVSSCLGLDLNKVNQESTGQEFKSSTDDPIQFLNEASFPKLLAKSDKLASLYNNWNEKQFYENNMLSAFVFATLYENGVPVEKTNLKHFTQSVVQNLLTENEKKSKFYLGFSMPNFIKKNIFLPNVLKCKQLEDNFEDLVSF